MPSAVVGKWMWQQGNTKRVQPSFTRTIMMRLCFALCPVATLLSHSNLHYSKHKIRSPMKTLLSTLPILILHTCLLCGAGNIRLFSTGNTHWTASWASLFQSYDSEMFPNFILAFFRPMRYSPEFCVRFLFLHLVLDFLPPAVPRCVISIPTFPLSFCFLLFEAFISVTYI